MSRSGLPAKVRKLLRILSNRLFASALRRGAAAGIEHMPILRHLSVRTVVDVGANRGQFALAVRHCFPDATIFSFEPLPGPATIFCRVFAADTSVHLFGAAIGPETGEATIHVSARDDSSSLLPIGAEQSRIFPATAEARTDTIKVGRLADFLFGRMPDRRP